MIGVRKLSPGGYEYLTGSVACGDRELNPGESLSDYYTATGYPPGVWFGTGAQALGVSGEVTAAQMNALFGEGRHPDADRIEAEQIAAGASRDEALKATKLGNRFPQYGGTDGLRSKVIDAYKAYNLEHDRPIGAAIDEDTRTTIRRNVQMQAYAGAHEGQRPSENELVKWLAEQKRELKSATSGYELVFAPPKSVSVAWALSDSDTRERIVGLHRQAVRDTLTYLENNVAFTRKGAGGYAQHDVQGITAALFEHWDSRAGDPHLHTHVPISAKVQGPDGTWTSLDGRTILAASVTTSEYYDSRLRDLFREHGAGWRERPRGGFDLKRMGWELDGVPDELLRGFSQRATHVEADRAHRIVAHRREHGREPTPGELREISRSAKYGTRDAKQGPRTLAQHLNRWQQQAGEMVDESVLNSLGTRVFTGQQEAVADIDVGDLAARTRAVVSDHFSHFNTWNITAEAHRQTAHLRVANGTRDAVIGRIVGAVLDDRDTVALQAPPAVEEPSELRRASGESVFVEHNAQRFTTHRTLREEAALAAWGRRRDGHRISAETVHRVLDGARLNPGQQHAVAGFARSGRRIQLLYAPAGAGKTTTMRAFADAWRADGGRVFAFGPSARAAQELGDSIKARPHTLHQVTTALQHGTAERSFDVTRGDVLVIDEAAMAGTHTLHDVVRYALQRGADVRLVGDDKQLAAVEAGGAVRWFAQHNSPLRLREVVRFADRNQATASLQLHAGDTAGLDYYLRQGWVSGGSRETMREAAHRAWRADLDSGRQSLLIVPTTDDVTALNRQARQLRLHRGDVDAGRSVQLHDGTAASTGDRVVTRHNDRLTTLFGGKDFVKNGDTWQVSNVRRSGAIKVRHQSSGGTVVLPADYVAEHVELAYAATVNRCQGMSVSGSAHGIVPQGLSREQLYTLLTRARHDNRVYVETHQHTIDSHQETPPEQTARSVLEAALARSSAETPATEQLRASLANAESLHTLVGQHDYAAHLGTEKRIDTVLTEHAPTLLDCPAAPALRQTVRTAEDLGWHTEHLIPTTLAQGPLADTDDPAAVLQWSIQQRVLREKPPERTAAPTMAAINHWRTLVEGHDPTADVEEPTWMPVWRRAAAATAEGLDADTALTRAANQLANRPSNDPTDAHRYTATALSAALAEQRDHGAGRQPTLPWLTRPDHTTLATDNRDYLRRLENAIHSRHAELRAQVTADPPRWTAALGPRPNDPTATQRWDHLAGLAAAYRDTYNITTNDPEHPLGEEPGGQGLRARAWHQLIDAWGPPDPGEHTTSGHRDTAIENTLDRIRAELDPEELLSTLAENDPISTFRHEEPLSVTVERHQHASRELLNRTAHQALSQHAPQALDHPAEGALLATLRRAEQAGWQADRLVGRTAGQGSLDNVDDPAAVLRWRVEQHLAEHQPPARTADPAPEQIDRWQHLITETAPQTKVTTDAWNLVWRHAAAGAVEGLDTDTAVSTAAHHLAERPIADPTDQHRYVAQSVVDQLAEQRNQGAGHRPALPWMTDPPHTTQAADPELAEHIQQLNDTARARLDELRSEITQNPPSWTAGLGPRPQNPDAAEHWDETITLAAAYRETYTIRTTTPDTPLGPEPGGNNAQADAWRIITDQWRQAVSTPNANHQHDGTLERVEALRDQVLDTRADHPDEDETQYEDEHFDDDQGLDHDNGFHSGMGL